jgi:myosin-crossreactive antigen
MIDKDGEYEYSNVIFLENDLNSIDYAFYPNPTKDIVHYQYKGKIDEDLNIELLDHLGRIIRKQSTIGIEGFNLIPIKPEVTQSFHHLNSFYQRDPFDRMLIWQAITENYTLITKDSTINLYKTEGLKTIW